MEKRTLRIVAIVSALVFVGTVGVTVIATGGDSSGGGSGLMAHLHGGGHHHDPMAELIEQLDLAPDQRERLDRVHEIIGSHGDHRGAMFELHNTLMEQFKRGQMDAGDIRQVIDRHVEQMRETVYAATDELVALIDGLDARQRDIVMQHIQAAEEKAQRHGR